MSKTPVNQHDELPPFTEREQRALICMACLWAVVALLNAALAIHIAGF